MKPSERLSAAVVPLLLVLAGCGDDPTGPVQDPLPLLIHRTTAWFASEPQVRQRGEFFYDSEGRITRYEFSLNRTGEWRTTIKKDFLHRDDGRMLGWDNHIRLLDGSWWLNRIVRYGYDEARGLPVEVYVEEVHERTGEVTVDTIGIVYNARNQVVEERVGTQILRYTYDENGDVTEIRSGILVATLSYSKALNPFADLPPRLHGEVERGIFAPGAFSRHLSNAWENAVEGQPPAAKATAIIETNAQGYPVRREYTVWNTSDPDVKTVMVTEYEYLTQ